MLPEDVVIDDVVPPLALLQHPLQLLALPADVPLNGYGPQDLSPGEHHDRLPPHPLPEQAHMLLDAGAVHVREHAHWDDEQEGVGARQAHGGASEHFLLVHGRRVLDREPPGRIHHCHAAACNLRLTLDAELGGPLQAELLVAQDGVPCQALPRPPPA